MIRQMVENNSPCGKDLLWDLLKCPIGGTLIGYSIQLKTKKNRIKEIELELTRLEDELVKIR